MFRRWVRGLRRKWDDCSVGGLKQMRVAQRVLRHERVVWKPYIVLISSIGGVEERMCCPVVLVFVN